MSTTQKWWTTAIMLALIAGAVWWFWRPSDRVRLEALQAQMRDESLSDEDRRALRQEFRDGLRAMSEADREQFFANGFRGRMNRDLDEFFALAPKQRLAYLDREIKESEQRRKQFAAGQGQRGPGGGGPNQGPPGGFGGGGNRSPAEREQARKRRLDYSSAEDRAKRVEYMRQLNERRVARGLEPSRRS